MAIVKKSFGKNYLRCYKNEKGKGAFSAESSIPSSRRPDEPPVSAMSCSCSRSICGLDNRIIWQVPRKPVGSFQ